MECRGVCITCSNPCYRGEVKGNQRKLAEIPTNFSEEEKKGISAAFDTPVTLPQQTNETGLAVVESIGTYEVTRNIFGKEKVRKKK